MSKCAVLGLVELAGGAVERGLERQALAQYRIEQTQGGATCRKPGWVRRSQLRRPSGFSALARPPATLSVTGGGEWRPSSSAIASRAAMRFSVAGCVENRLSPRPRPGTM